MDFNSGHVRIYEWNGSSWVQQGQDIDGEAADDYSGGSVSMNASGDRVAIGAGGNDGNGNDNRGHVEFMNGTEPHGHKVKTLMEKQLVIIWIVKFL